MLHWSKVSRAWLRPKQKMELNFLLTTEKIVIQTCYYSGVLPFKWNPLTNKIIEISCKWEILRWIALLVIRGMIKIQLVLIFIAFIISGKFDLTKYTQIFQFGYTIIQLITGILEVHLFFHRRELLLSVNEQNSYFLQYIRLFGIGNISKKVKRASYFLAAPNLLLIYLAMIGAPIVCLIDCELHIFVFVSEDFCPILGSKLSFLSIASVFLKLLLQIVSAFYIVAIFSIYGVVTLPLFVLGNDIAKETNPQIVSTLTKQNLRTWRNWIRQYRWTQIVIQQYNICIGEPILDLVTSFLIAIHVLNLFIFITQDLSFFLLILLASCQCGLICLYYCFYQETSKLSDNIRLAKAGFASHCLTKHRRKIFSSFPPVRICIGKFMKIGSVAICIVIDLIIICTANVVITYSSLGF